MSGEEMENAEPSDDVSIECHLQQVGMGTLTCRAARHSSDRTTNEVSPSICHQCEAGIIYREVGCDAVLPKLTIRDYGQQNVPELESLFCKIRRRETTLPFCRGCGLVMAETTRTLVTTARNLFEVHGFYSAYQDLEKAREAIRDGDFDHAITRSISSLESAMRVCHEMLGAPLPGRPQISDLWKSTRNVLRFDEVVPERASLNLMNALTGVVTQLGGLRNTLGDAHGKGVKPPAVLESEAELAINVSSTLATAVVRRFIQIGGQK